MKFIKTEPVLISSVVQVIVALISATVVHLSATESGAVLAVTTAVLALISAIATRPFHVSALTGLISAGVTLLVAFGIHGVQPGVVSTINAALVGIAALIVRLHVTPAIRVKEPNGTFKAEAALVP